MAKKVTEKAQSHHRRMVEVIRVLKQTYPEAECSLTHRNAFELLISTILSAQCTDVRVNQTTPELFRRYPTPKDLAQAKIETLETLLKPLGFFRAKSKAIREAAISIVETCGGEVPNTLEELIKLRGVGRKTANVVLGNAFGVPGLVVDTHVKRLSYRLGFTDQKDPEKVERELMEIVPEEDWTHYGHLIIFHGRAICTARVAKCHECTLQILCPKRL